MLASHDRRRVRQSCRQHGPCPTEEDTILETSKSFSLIRTDY